MRDKLLEAFKTHAEGEIRKHIANIEVFLNNPVGVAEHPDTIDTIGKEMEALADWNDKLEMANKYF
jgi:hypothetical protein